jgi:hypothetical protein
MSVVVGCVRLRSASSGLPADVASAAQLTRRSLPRYFDHQSILVGRHNLQRARRLDDDDVKAEAGCPEAHVPDDSGPSGAMPMSMNDWFALSRSPRGLATEEPEGRRPEHHLVRYPLRASEASVSEGDPAWRPSPSTLRSNCADRRAPPACAPPGRA